jgi:hypothetical protein
MIPKSGYRFSEKIMLKQQYPSGAPAQASIQGARGSGHATAGYRFCVQARCQSSVPTCPGWEARDRESIFRRSVQRPALENAINKRNREHVAIPQEPDMR